MVTTSFFPAELIKLLNVLQIISENHCTNKNKYTQTTNRKLKQSDIVISQSRSRRISFHCPIFLESVVQTWCSVRFQLTVSSRKVYGESFRPKGYYSRTHLGLFRLFSSERSFFLHFCHNCLFLLSLNLFSDFSQENKRNKNKIK